MPRRITASNAAGPPTVPSPGKRLGPTLSTSPYFRWSSWHQGRNIGKVPSAEVRPASTITEESTCSSSSECSSSPFCPSSGWSPPSAAFTWRPTRRASARWWSPSPARCSAGRCRSSTRPRRRSRASRWRSGPSSSSSSPRSSPITSRCTRAPWRRSRRCSARSRPTCACS